MFKRLFKKKKKVCGAEFPKRTANVDLICTLSPHHPTVFHEGRNGDSYARWRVDSLGSVLIETLKIG